MRPSEEVRREIIRRYDRDPSDWSVFFSKDSRGHYNLIAVHGGQMWLIKEETVNPYKSVGFGLRTMVDEAVRVREPPRHPFGLRPVETSEAKEIMQALESGEKIGPLIGRILESKPAPSHEIRTSMMLQGPMLQIPSGVEFLSDKHRQLDMRLRHQLEHLLYQKYPHIVTQYV